MEIDDKWGKLEQRYVNASWGEVEVGHGQRGSNIEEWRRIKKFWTREAHKQGEQAHEL